MKRILTLTILTIIVLGLLAGCGAPATASPSGATSAAGTQASTAASSGKQTGGATKITLGAYTTPREAYAKIIPLFKKSWKDKTGQDVAFEESYLGSGAQSRAIVEGFDADVAALSLEADITRIEKAGLITHDWHTLSHNGMVSTSIV